MWTAIHRNANKYGAQVNSHDALKCAAVLLMTIDHIGFFFDPDTLWWRVVGRWCVPIWFFLAGYTRPSTRYPRELVTLAAIMVIADILLAEPVLPLNILVSILIARRFIAAIQHYDQDIVTLLLLTLFCMLLWPFTAALFGYGTQVFLFALAGFYARGADTTGKAWLAPLTLVLATMLLTVTQYISFGMTPVQGIVMAAGLTGVAWYLCYFTPRHYPLLSGWSGQVMLRYMGRNTHYYYCGHYLLFLIIQTWLSD